MTLRLWISQLSGKAQSDNVVLPGEFTQERNSVPS